MALLTGAITVLSLAGTPGLPTTYTAKDTGAGASRPYTVTFTQLGVSATPGRVLTFSAKTESTEEIKYVTDTYVAVLTFESVDAVDLDVTDVYLPVLTMSAVVGVGRLTYDTYLPRVTLTVTALQKAGVSFTANVTDSYVPKLAFLVTQREVFSVTDSYVPVLTLTASLQAADLVALTDSYVPVLGMDPLLDTILATRRFDRTDVYVPVLTMSATAGTAGEVDFIHIFERPYGHIRITEA